MNFKTLVPTEDATAKAHRWPLRVPIACGIVLLAALASYAVFSSDPWSEERGNRLPASFRLDLQEQVAIDPDQIRYQLHSQIAIPLESTRAITTGPHDEIYVAGDRAVHVFAANGDPQYVVELEGEPSCLAVGGAEHIEPGRLYVGVARGVQVFHADRQSAGSWQLPNEQAVLTCVAIGENDVFVADAGNRRVWRFNAEGRLVSEIGAPDETRKAPGFVVPSPHFDVVVGAADLVHIANPGKLQVATYTFNGDFGAAWGRADSDLSGFFGCCNPAHLAMLPDGRFVTSEKGIPRVKIYSPQGEFEAVVAGPQQLGLDELAVGDPRAESHSSFDIAVDRRGRVLVLDAQSKMVRIFVVKDREGRAGDSA